MSLTHLLGLLLVVLCLLFVGMGLIPSAPDAEGRDHPGFPPGTLQQAPPDRDSPPLLLAGGLFLAVTYLFAAVCLLLGIRRERRGKVLPVFIAGCVACVLSVAVVSYWHAFPSERLPAYAGGFPLATAALLYLVPFAPFVFVILYSVAFSRWVITPEDERAFHELVSRSSEGP